MRFHAIGMDDIPLLSRYFNSYPSYRICDYSVGGALMWQAYFGYECCEEDSCLYMRQSDGDGGWAYFLPLGDIRKTVTRLLEENDGHVSLTCVPESALVELDSLFSCKASQNRDWSDYLYQAKDLATLEGHLYAKKRNFIQQFLRHSPDYHFDKLGEDNIQSAIAFLEEWSKQAVSPLAVYEDGQSLKVLQNFSSYPFHGLVLYVDGDVKGFSIGEVVGDTLFDHIEKADTTVKGSYQMICREVARQAIKDYGVSYINREEDVGDAGLRKSKESYFPTQLLMKYDVEVSFKA